MSNRTVRMTAALVLAAVLAGLSALCLGLVDAGQALETELSGLEYEAGSLHRAVLNAIERGSPADTIARPRASLKRVIDSFGATADRIVGETAPPYARPIARVLSPAIDLVPQSDPIDRAFRDYLDQVDQAQAGAARSTGAIEMWDRLLELGYGRLVQQISEARERTRRAVSSALFGVQLITLTSVGIAALTLGLTAEE